MYFNMIAHIGLGLPLLATAPQFPVNPHLWSGKDPHRPDLLGSVILGEGLCGLDLPHLRLLNLTPEFNEVARRTSTLQRFFSHVPYWSLSYVLGVTDGTRTHNNRNHNPGLYHWTTATIVYRNTYSMTANTINPFENINDVRCISATASSSVWYSTVYSFIMYPVKAILIAANNTIFLCPCQEYEDRIFSIKYEEEVASLLICERAKT